MKQLLLMIALVGAGGGCGGNEAKKPDLPKTVPNSPYAKAVIEREIRKKLEKPTGELTKTDLERVTELYLTSNQITDVSALAEQMKELQVLDLGNNQLTDVSALARLTKLKLLNLRRNQISDIRPLGGLTRIVTLNLSDNQLTNVSALKGLGRLEYLYLHDNQLTDKQLKYLAGFKQLKELSLVGNPKLTKAEVDKLKKSLVKCEIEHDAKK